jgi:protein involved in polysaccharide export with SLBB domain
MGKAAANRRVVGALGLALCLLAGCSLSGGGSRLTLFPEGHRLTDEAKAMRDSFPEPLPLPRELDKRVLPSYVVEPGDVLLVQPTDLDAPVRLPGDQPVLPDGTINLGRYGRIIVAGRTVDEIETMVRAVVEAREKDKSPGPISVRIITRASKVYYVLGEVNAPGEFVLNGRETVLDGIVTAGGLTDRASRRNIILSRPTRPDSCRVVLPVCYYDIVQLGDTSTNYQLAPGDRIYVPSRTCWEELFHNRPECPPCGRPQVPCSAAGAGCDAAAPGAAPAALPQPALRYEPMPPADKETPNGQPAPEVKPSAGAAPERLPSRVPTPLDGPQLPAAEPMPHAAQEAAAPRMRWPFFWKMLSQD